MGLAAGAAALGAYGTYQQQSAQKDALGFSADVAARNADFSQWQAGQARVAGQQQETYSRLNTRQTIGQQQVALAANGVEMTSGSPLDVLSSTAYMGEQDALTIRRNTDMQVFGYQRQGANYANEARQYRRAAGNINPALGAATSLLGGASQLKNLP